jgi:hypothetical protein
VRGVLLGRERPQELLLVEREQVGRDRRRDLGAEETRHRVVLGAVAPEHEADEVVVERRARRERGERPRSLLLAPEEHPPHALAAGRVER